MRKLQLALLALLLAPIEAHAQGACPYIAYRAVLTAEEWNACFSAKQNALGFTPINKAGDTMLGPLVTAPSTSGAAGLNVPPGTAPSSPANGDVWETASGVFVRYGGQTYQLQAQGTSAAVNGQPSNPTGTASGTGVMMGLGSTCKLTPATSGRIHVTWSGYFTNATTSGITAYQGTGTAPTNGASLVGTPESPLITLGGSGAGQSFSITYLVTGQAIGTALWADLALKSGSGTSSILSLTCAIFEF